MRVLRIIAPLALIIAPALAEAAPHNFQELANLLVLIMNNAAIVLIVLGIVVYFWGISTSMFGVQTGGVAARKKLTTYLIWGLIVLFVMVSIWGILQVLQNTLFTSESFNVNYGSSGGGTGGTFDPTPIQTF